VEARPIHLYEHGSRNKNYTKPDSLTNRKTRIGYYLLRLKFVSKLVEAADGFLTQSDEYFRHGNDALYQSF